MLPNGWESVPIGKICRSIVPGRNKPKVFEGTIPWVTTPEICGRYIPSKLQKNFVSLEEIKKAGGKIVPPGSVIIACVGELGITAIAKTEVVINQQLHAFVCPDFIDNEYLAYWLENQKKYMESVASKTTLPYMNKSNCESIPVHYPSLIEQRKIADLLGTWDQAIETVEALIANSQAQKKALMQQLLTGKRRLPGFSGDAKDLPVTEVARIETGSSNREDSDLKGEFTFFDRSTDVRRSDRFIFDTEAVIVGGEGQEFIPKYFIGKFDLHQRAYAIFDFTNTHGRYVFYSVHFNRHLLKRYSVGSTVASLRMGTFKKIPIRMVSLEEQSSIAKVLSNCDELIDVYEKSLNRLKCEKNALMQQLLTGKRRVNVGELAYA